MNSTAPPLLQSTAAVPAAAGGSRCASVVSRPLPQGKWLQGRTACTASQPLQHCQQPRTLWQGGRKHLLKCKCQMPRRYIQLRRWRGRESVGDLPCSFTYSVQCRCKSHTARYKGLGRSMVAEEGTVVSTTCLNRSMACNSEAIAACCTPPQLLSPSMPQLPLLPWRLLCYAECWRRRLSQCLKPPKPEGFAISISSLREIGTPMQYQGCTVPGGLLQASLTFVVTNH